MRTELLGRVFRRRWVVVAAAASVLAVASLGAARLIPLPLMQEENANPNQQQTVYVRDSAIAADKFELAKRMERLKEWHKSADVYQEIVEKYKDRLVLTRTDTAGRPAAYQSITVAVQERLARWPEDGMAVYRARFEPQAATMLASAGRADVETLHRVFNQFFVTDSAREAGTRLMDLALETGEFPEATWIGDRLLQWHPNLTGGRPGVLFRTATAYHLAGDTATARKRLDELKTNHAAEQVTVAGKQSNIVEALDQQLAQKPPAASAGHGNTSWRTFGGDETRNLVFDVAAQPADRIYSIPVAGLDSESVPAAQQASFTMGLRTAREQGLTINVIPSVDHGELYFQDGMRMYAVRLESGVPLPGWLQTYPGTGQFRLDTARRQDAPANMRVDAWAQQAMLAPRQHTITITDDAVLAVMGAPAVRVGTLSGSGTQLVCLDRATGMMRWSADPRNLPNNPGNAKNINFSGSPLVVGDNVYVIARGNAGAGSEDCSVFCYALDGGGLKWSSYIASSQTAQPNMFGGGVTPPAGSDSASHLAFASGRVYVLTNLGAIAAIDAYSGDTAWLSLYERDLGQVFSRQRRINVPQQAAGDRGKPWEFNSVIVKEGKLFALPADGQHLLICEAGSGQEIKRISSKVELPSGVTHELKMLLGVIDKTLVVSSDKAVLLLDWTVLEQTKPDSNRINADHSLLYLMELDTLWGRPFLARDQMLVPNKATRPPSKDGVKFFDMKKLRVTAAYPADGVWSSEEEGLGNIIAVQNHVIIANADNVSVYTDLAGVRQRYQVAIQSDPTNLDARLIFSELMFNAGKREEAIEALNEAVAVLGGREQMRPGAARDRVFSDAVMFAQKLAAMKKADALQTAGELFDLAGSAAFTPAQQVSYRMSRAKHLREDLKSAGQEPDLGRAVALYQEILLDGAMRPLKVSAENGGFSSAAQIAEEAIEQIVRQSGSRFYEPFAKEAAAKFKAMSDQAEPEALRALAEQYPNAVSMATAAMMRAAQILEQQDKPRLATQVLRQLHWKYVARLTDPQKQASTEALARTLLKVDNIGAASGRLHLLASAMPDAKLSGPLKLGDGSVLAGANGKPALTFKEAAEALAGMAQKRRALPVAQLKLPIPTPEDRMQDKPWPKPFVEPAGEAIIPNVQALISAPFDGGWRTDRTVAWSGGRLICLAPGQAQPLWSSPAIGEKPAGLYWVGDKLLVWGGAEVNLIDGQRGTRLWSSQISALPVADVLPGLQGDDVPVAGLGAEMAIEERLVMGNRIVRIGGGMVAAQVAMAPQQVEIQQPAENRELVAQVVPLSGSVVFSTNAGRIVALDLDQGRTLWQGRLGDGVTLRQLIATEDFVAARFQIGATARIVVMDSFSGQVVHRRAFSAASAAAPVNCVLSPDGTLVWTTAGAISGKDLYEAGDAPTWERPGRSYAGMTLPDQLIVQGQEVLALCQNGTYIDRRKLRTGEPIGNPLSTYVKVDAPRMRLDGPRVYVAGRNSLVSYHLEQDTACPMHPYPEVEWRPADIMLTEEYTAVPGRIVKEVKNEHTFTLHFYSRALIRTKTGTLCESGLNTQRWDFEEPKGVQAWHSVNGGIYYLTGDERLVWLKAVMR